jgi:hypothetical protein
LSGKPGAFEEVVLEIPGAVEVGEPIRLGVVAAREGKPAVADLSQGMPYGSYHYWLYQ